MAVSDSDIKIPERLNVIVIIIFNISNDISLANRKQRLLMIQNVRKQLFTDFYR